MTSDKDVRLRRRSKLLRQAQMMARSGRYSDHEAILGELRQHEDYWSRMEERYVRHQLDRLCEIARRKKDTIRNETAACAPPTRKRISDYPGG
jgi:hypothetical protein